MHNCIDPLQIFAAPRPLLGETTLLMAPDEKMKSNQEPSNPTFQFTDRLKLFLWRVSWTVFASWTPRQFNGWRCFLLRLFGAKLAKNAVVRSSVKIWSPARLYMDEGAVLGPDVICYNMAPVRIGNGALVSQRAELCTGTHSISDPKFGLVAQSITVEERAWVAANSFVGPGVRIGEGAVLGACAVTCSDLEPWTVYVGNPAKPIKKRILEETPAGVRE